MPDATTLCAAKMRQRIAVAASGSRGNSCGQRMLNISRPFKPAPLPADESYRAWLKLVKNFLREYSALRLSSNSYRSLENPCGIPLENTSSFRR